MCPMMKVLFEDCRYGLRTLCERPGFALGHE
jgi:hypothetical protein